MATSLASLIKKIEDNEILLPDFQREFAWRDEETQRKIVASVLAKMPIGSVLLLTSKHDEYSVKKIGCNTELDTSALKDKVDFLLDGQQRVTVLSNVFSNCIHNLYDNITELVSPSLKRRFFLKIPKWSIKLKDKADYLHIYDLKRFVDNPHEGEPDFLASEIIDYVVYFTFKKNDETSYNPQNPLDDGLDSFCLDYKDENNEAWYLFPLFLLVPSSGGNREVENTRKQRIHEHIMNGIKDEIVAEFSKSTTEGKKLLIRDIFGEDGIEELYDKPEKFKARVEDKVMVWYGDFKAYLDSCVTADLMHQIVVDEEKRERAIDIYENLNRGGISLSTFDLIMARVAKVNKDNFYKRMVGYIVSDKTYPTKVVPKKILTIKKSGKRTVDDTEEDEAMNETLKTLIESNKYNASTSTRCYNEKKNEIAKIYIDVFLDVMGLYCSNTDFDIDSFKVDNMKRDVILNLSADQIDENAELVSRAIDRALFFFQTRCGIRDIKEINNSLIIVVIAIIFIKDEWFEGLAMHELLEAWYWTALFSGQFDKDQNENTIRNLKNIIKTIKHDQNVDWIIKRNSDEVFNTKYFSDQDFLLMEHASDDRIPKTVMRGFICQYMLSKTYCEMFDENKTVSVFRDDSDKLEMHHIVPLGSAKDKKVKQSTKELRGMKEHLCNSPINFVYITKEDNKRIGAESVEEYSKNITDNVKADLHIDSYTSVDSCSTNDKIKSILKNRFSGLKGDVQNHVNDLISLYQVESD